MASLADDRGLRSEDLEAAGVAGGTFSYWTERVERPPFDPPGEVVCQSLTFDTEEEAARFVDGLEAATGGVGVTALAWLPGDVTSTEENAIAESTLPVGARTFAIVAEGDGRTTELFAVTWASGRHVLSVYSGSSAGPSDRELVLEAARSLAARASSE